jgi:hypothetical protein
MKTISPVCNEVEWIMYVRVVMKSEIYGIELVVRMIAQNDVDDESFWLQTLPKAVDEQGVEYSVVLTQPSQESQDDTNADEPLFIGSNEIVLNMKHVLGSVGDVVADVEMISGVDHQPIIIAVTLTSDAPSIVLEFIVEYDVAFGDEQASYQRYGNEGRRRARSEGGVKFGGES